MKSLIYISAAIVSLCVCCSCTKTLYVPETHYVNTENTKLLRDTVRENHYYHTNDCTVNNISGDTVRIEHWRSTIDKSVLEHLQSVIDSLKSARRDSVAYPVEVVKLKEVNKLHWWQRWLIWLGGIVAVGGVMYGGIKVMPLIKKVV